MTISLAIFGLVLGSFIATLVLRWPAGRSVAGRSACDGCGSQLRVFELVPLLSFAVQRGRCRRCNAQINPIQPIIELAAALIGAGAALLYPPLQAVAFAGFGWTLLCLAALDWRAYWLPDVLTIPLALAGLVLGYLGQMPGFDDRLIGCLGAFATLTLIAWLYRRTRGIEGLGGGDPKLFGAIGAWLGWEPMPMVLLIAALTGLAIVCVCRLRGVVIKGTDRLPFGTLLAFAALATAALSTTN